MRIQTLGPVAGYNNPINLDDFSTWAKLDSVYTSQQSLVQLALSAAVKNGEEFLNTPFGKCEVEVLISAEDEDELRIHERTTSRITGAGYVSNFLSRYSDRTCISFTIPVARIDSLVSAEVITDTAGTLEAVANTDIAVTRKNNSVDIRYIGAGNPPSSDVDYGDKYRFVFNGGFDIHNHPDLKAAVYSHALSILNNAGDYEDEENQVHSHYAGMPTFTRGVYMSYRGVRFAR